MLKCTIIISGQVTSSTGVLINASVSGRYRHSMIDLPDLSKVPTKAAVDGTVYYTNNDTAYDTEVS